ncbi:hemerythrin [candidate division GN15 bacterium]|nr:hemerythrin [candidate division GN15 bacterium]
MEPTVILSNEHRVIELVLTCLERIAGKAKSDGKLDTESAVQALDFFRTFADGCHHGKEEDHLFPAMVNKGVPQQGGPIAVMLSDHEQGRAHIRAMTEHVEAAGAGEAAAIDEFARQAHGYIAMLRGHIQKEDQVLFPLADRIMGSDDEQKLMAAYHSVEHDHMGEGTHERYLKIAETLADRYDVPKDALAQAHESTSCGCGHAKKD